MNHEIAITGWILFGWMFTTSCIFAGICLHWSNKYFKLKNSRWKQLPKTKIDEWEGE